jgi:hypothetical protein
MGVPFIRDDHFQLLLGSAIAVPNDGEYAAQFHQLA